MKNVFIIGYGYVGKGVHASLEGEQFRSEFSNYIVDFYDPNVFGSADSVDNYQEYEAIFLCLPTPTSPINGECDYALVEKYVRQFTDYKGLLILKSTVSPSGIKHLLTINPDLIYIPEFLTEKNWLEDATAYHPNIVVGCRNDQIERITQFFKKAVFQKPRLFDGNTGYARSNYHIVDPVTASVYKYSVNSFLAMKVVFMHELHKWATNGTLNNTEWNKLTHMFNLNPRMGNSHTKAPGDHGYGYSGACFPKDVEAFINESKGDLSLLEQVDYRNKSLRRSNKNV